MSTDDLNPYQASKIDPKPSAHQRESLEYMRTVQYVFESPKWMTNLLWGGLCMLTTQIIPVVGQLVWMGYQFEIVEDLLHSPSKQGYLDFDANRFKDYLLRGLWIFLVMLVVMLVIMPVMLVLVAGGAAVVGVVGAATGGDEDAIGITMISLFAVFFVGMMVLSIFMALIMTPLTIRAGLTQDFRASFDVAWIKDFVRKMWLETILSQLFLMAVAVLAEIVGLLACLVGIFPAIAFLLLAQGHIMLQLYQLYLARGGEPIPLKTATPFGKPNAV